MEVLKLGFEEFDPSLRDFGRLGLSEPKVGIPERFESEAEAQGHDGRKHDSTSEEHSQGICEVFHSRRR